MPTVKYCIHSSNRTYLGRDYFRRNNQKQVSTAHKTSSCTTVTLPKPRGYLKRLAKSRHHLCPKAKKTQQQTNTHAAGGSFAQPNDGNEKSPVLSGYLRCRPWSLERGIKRQTKSNDTDRPANTAPLRLKKRLPPLRQRNRGLRVVKEAPYTAANHVCGVTSTRKHEVCMYHFETMYFQQYSRGLRPPTRVAYILNVKTNFSRKYQTSTGGGGGTGITGPPVVVSRSSRDEGPGAGLLKARHHRRRPRLV